MKLLPAVSGAACFDSPAGSALQVWGKQQLYLLHAICTVGQRARASGTAAPFRPPCDGVFRAVPPTFNAREYCGKILQQVRQWACC